MLYFFKYVFRVITGGTTARKFPARSNSKSNVFSSYDRLERKFPPFHEETAVRNVYKIKAKSEAEVRARIIDLPKVQVVHIKDGDTAVVTIGRDENVIRLDSIDCPEDGQPWGDIAAYGLIKLIGGKTVLLEQHGQDQYGRTLATIYCYNIERQEWVNVNERMVMLGHAWVRWKYFDHLPRDRQEKLKRMEKWARAKKVGLWKEQNPVPPWRWRYDSRD